MNSGMCAKNNKEDCEKIDVEVNNTEALNIQGKGIVFLRKLFGKTKTEVRG